MPPDETVPAAPAAMIAIDAGALDGSAAYKLVTGTVTPRPIAWISTVGEGGGVNLAPFSSYVFLAYDPPLVGVSIGPGTERLKDTLRNMLASRQFVVNSVSPAQLRPMVETSRRYPPHIGEAADLGIAMAPSRSVAPPRVAASEIALECVVERVVDLGDRDAHRFVIGRIVTFQVHSAVLKGDRIDPTAFRPVGRIGGPLYAMPGALQEEMPTQDDRFA
jgi:flavin reductase (DIM6/NTAB) family NADH-FMN oxidoreductase RutF